MKTQSFSLERLLHCPPPVFYNHKCAYQQFIAIKSRKRYFRWYPTMTLIHNVSRVKSGSIFSYRQPSWADIKPGWKNLLRTQKITFLAVKYRWYLPVKERRRPLSLHEWFTDIFHIRPVTFAVSERLNYWLRLRKKDLLIPVAILRVLLGVAEAAQTHPLYNISLISVSSLNCYRNPYKS